jgi:FeS assembly SUF system protein
MEPEKAKTEAGNGFLQLETIIVNELRNIYDPEIPVNIFDLGLIYEVNVDEQNNVEVKMTMTAPNCPMADELLTEVEQRIKTIPAVKEFKLTLTFEPPWSKDMMSEEALLELGLL